MSLVKYDLFVRIFDFIRHAGKMELTSGSISYSCWESS